MVSFVPIKPTFFNPIFWAAAHVDSTMLNNGIGDFGSISSKTICGVLDAIAANSAPAP